MSWSQVNRLFRKTDDGQQIGFTSDDDLSEDARRTILQRNHLVNGSETIANLIMEKGEYVRLRKGQEFIREGESDDCAYFLLAGKVDVTINGHHRDSRGAPDSVGELAAFEPMYKRSASVRVASNQLLAYCICGDDFRALMRKSRKFRDQLLVYTQSMLRARMSEYGRTTGKSQVGWLLLSVIVAITVAALSFYGASLMGIRDALQPFFAMIAGLGSFVLMAQMNPAYFYKRMIATVIFGAFIAPMSLGVRYDEGLKFVYEIGRLRSADAVVLYIFSACALALLVWKDPVK